MLTWPQSTGLVLWVLALLIGLWYIVELNYRNNLGYLISLLLLCAVFIGTLFVSNPYWILSDMIVGAIIFAVLAINLWLQLQNKANLLYRLNLKYLKRNGALTKTTATKMA